ncbi:hypothetical protein Tco_0627409 [Tanacetum coccineum]|uniref:Uncharacterized protein n=1 Tax=Tanacetum coccineum TaxID=301880 RepID=A0ABQ4WMB0_9ASTR
MAMMMSMSGLLLGLATYLYNTQQSCVIPVLNLVLFDPYLGLETGKVSKTEHVGIYLSLSGLYITVDNTGSVSASGVVIVFVVILVDISQPDETNLQRLTLYLQMQVTAHKYSTLSSIPRVDGLIFLEGAGVVGLARGDVLILFFRVIRPAQSGAKVDEIREREREKRERERERERDDAARERERSEMRKAKGDGRKQMGGAEKGVGK